MPIGSGSLLRQLSGGESWKSTSKRWATGNNINMFGGGEGSSEQMEVLGMDGSGGGVGGGDGGVGMRKRVMVLVDDSSHSKHAMMWALTHVTNKGDLLTLLHIIPPSHEIPSNHYSSYSPYLATSLGSLCKACKPEVEVEALVIQGPKLGIVMSQVKKLEVSVLVLGQKKPTPLLFNCLCGGISSTEKFVEQCINNVECLTMGVRKQSKGIGGYLISTKWQKNFWLLA